MFFPAVFSGAHLVERHHPDVPLAVCSASAAADAADECMQAGADAYIEKTTGAPHVVDALRNLLLDAPLSNQPVTDAWGPTTAPQSW